MKGNRKYIAILTVMVIAFGLIEYYRPKPIDWRITLSNQDKIPFGTYATFELLKEVFPKQSVSSTRLPAFNQLTETNQNKGNYIFVTNYFAADENDTKELLKFVSKGNNLFIAATTFNGPFADTLNINTGADFYEKQYTTKLINVNKGKSFKFISPRENSFFDSLDHKTTLVLGRKESGKPDFVRIKHGKGNIYLNVNPTAFSNYFVLDKATKDYAFECLSYLPIKPVIWDEYTKQGRVGEDDAFRVLMEHPSLKWAYYIMILGIVVFIIFESKRRQRIIPIIPPLPNNTLEFTKVVGALYFNKGDHHDAAIKKINYLLEYIRTRFFERTNVIDDEFIEHIAEKTGWDKIKNKQLFEMIRWVKSRPEEYVLSEEDLLLLNDLIEEFYEFVKK